MLVKEIIIKALQQIQREKITATPEVYEKAFCQIARREGMDLIECKRALAFVEKLPATQKTQAKNRNITQLDELAHFLVGEISRSAHLPQKDATKVVNELVNLLAKAMTPSFADFDTKAINELISSIELAPNKVLEKSWQTKVVRLVAERISFDRKRISSEANELSLGVDALYKVVQKLSRELRNGGADIELIRSEIKILDPENFTKKVFKDLKEKLESVATTLQTHSDNLISTVSTQEAEIARLKNHINELNSKLSALAMENSLDYLTQVESRRAVDRALEELESRYQKTGVLYAVLFFDVDHFKRINDSYGHEGGDKVLQAVAELIRGKAPNDSVVGRYGGEEFVVLLRSTDDAALVAEAVRKDVEASLFKYQDKTIKMTISCGVSTRGEVADKDECVRLADERLYSAKNSGRNRVVS